MKLLGQDVIFSLAGETVAFATSCEIGTDTDFIEVCSPVSGADKEYLPTTFGWSLSGNYLCANLADKARLIELQRANTKFEVRIFDRELSTVLRGYCYIKSLSLSASKGSLAKFAATYQPTGGLEKVEADRLYIGIYSGHEVENYGINWDDSNHKFVPRPSSSLIRQAVVVCSLQVSSLSRVYVDTSVNKVILCKGSANFTELDEIVKSGDMLNFYAKYELDHFADNEHSSVVLKPGNYWFVFEAMARSYPYDVDIRLLRSLPETN